MSSHNSSDKAMAITAGVVLFGLFIAGKMMDIPSRETASAVGVVNANNTSSNSSGTAGKHIYIENNNMQYPEISRPVYHYTVSSHVVDVDPEFYEIEHVNGKLYRVIRDNDYYPADEYYEFDTEEYLGTAEEIYKYSRDLRY